MQLQFREFDVRELGSLADAVRAAGFTSGIYWIIFEDGSEYVGQSVSLGARLSTHRRKQLGTMRTVSIASVPPAQLDEAERYWISARDRELRSDSAALGLRNKLITDRPGGLGDFEVTVRPGVVIPLPWERERRGRIPAAWESGVELPAITPRQREQWARLQAHESWPELGAFLHDFLGETMSSPQLTQGRLWTISAFPNTSRMPGWQRLCTVNVGKIEALFVGDDAEVGPVVQWNVAVPGFSMRDAFMKATRSPRIQSERYTGYAAPVQHLEVVGLAAAHRLLGKPVIKELAYQFNTHWQREGMTLQGRWHNWEMAKELLG